MLRQLVQGNQNYYVILSEASSSDGDYDGINPSDVPVVNVDDETAGITIGAISGDTSEDGTSGVFTVVLNSQPTADVNIALHSSDETEGTVSPLNLTFTSDDWDIYQIVTVTGVEDEIADGDIEYEILLTSTSDDSNYDGLTIDSVSATNLDISESTNSTDTDTDTTTNDDDGDNDDGGGSNGLCFIKSACDNLGSNK